MFSSGTMVEVSYKTNETEVVWVPAMVIKEINENDEKRYLVEICVKGKPNITVDLASVRPTPPPSPVEENQYVEAFHYTSWRQARVKQILPGKWCVVLLEDTNKELCFKLSDIRPLKVWEDGVWKPRESWLTQGSVNDSTLVENEDNNRKRKRELVSVAIDEGNEAKDTTMVLPFEKKLPIWKTFESMEAFKIFPQSPHFSPLLESREGSREMSAVGMMLTFSGLLEEVKDLQPKDPISSLSSLSESFAELEKHGFDVKAPELRMSKLLSLRDKKAKKMDELKCAEKVTAEKESLKVENERKILELQRLNEEAEKEVAKSKSCEAIIVKQLEDVELQFQTTASAPWFSVI